MKCPERFRRFLFPSLTPRYMLRLVIVAVTAYLVFGHLCLPLWLQGTSMEPTYHDGALNFCWRPAYLFSEPQRGDVVLVRFAGSRVMLLKRIVALAGDTVEFRNGIMFVNGAAQDEPYITFPCDWNLPPRQVEPGNAYFVGDNRSMPQEQHDFGQTSLRRIQGTLLW